MKYIVEEFVNIDLDKVDPGNFVDIERWTIILNKLKEIKNMLDEMVNIIETNVDFPKSLTQRTRTYVAAFTSYLNQISNDKKGDPSQLAREKATIFSQIDGWYRELFEKTNQKNDQLGFFETFSAIKSLDSRSASVDYDKINALKEKSISDSESIAKILNEFQKKGSKETVSDYAEIFKSESEENIRISNIWLGSGITLSIGFILLLFFYDFSDKFPTQEVLSNGSSVFYNIGNIVTKILIYTILIFIISFTFKQYSIRRHLSTINKHRQNGMDSFKLFIESIDKEDFETRHTLMLQLAKSIYEQTSSGYIADRGGKFKFGNCRNHENDKRK